MIALLTIVLQVLTDLARTGCLAVRRQGALAAQILMLRRQLAMYVERAVKPRRVDPVDPVASRNSSDAIWQAQADRSMTHDGWSAGILRCNVPPPPSLATVSPSRKLAVRRWPISRSIASPTS